MKRSLACLTVIVSLLSVGSVAGAAAKATPKISVTAGKVSVSSAGGKVTIRAVLKTTTGKCAWSSVPKVKGFPATVNCAKALSRAISLPKNTGKDSRSYVAKLTRLSTPKLAATARVTVLSKAVALVAALGSIHSTLASSSSSTGSARASIDPTYTQDKANPLKVTFDFSASETDGALPNGVLSFYWGSTPQSQSLACSINVGGAITGGQCTITFPAYGAEYVTTTYTSGTNSATETDQENITNPNPVVTTTTVAGPLVTTTSVTLIETNNAAPGVYSLSATPLVTDKNGAVVGIPASSVALKLEDVTPLTPVVLATWTVSTNGSLGTAQMGIFDSPAEVRFIPNGGSVAGPGEVDGTHGDAFAIVATFSGTTLDAPSASNATPILSS